MNSDDEIRRLLSEILVTNQKLLRISEESAQRIQRSVKLQTTWWRVWLLFIVLAVTALAYFCFVVLKVNL